MKRYIACLLSLLVLLGVLTGCQGGAGASTDSTTGAFIDQSYQSPEEQEVLKILTIGNSHSSDANTLLYEVFKKEAPEQKIVIGYLYYSGCNMGQHVKFMTENAAEYIYYKNGNFDGAKADGSWWRSDQDGTGKVTADVALKDEQWDVVVLQQMSTYVGNSGGYSTAEFNAVIGYVEKYVGTDATLAWHMTWTHPDEEAYLGGNLNLSASGHEAWKNRHVKWYPSESNPSIYDQSVMYAKVVEHTQQYIENDTKFLGADKFAFVLPSCTAVEYVQDVGKLTQAQAYRDYTHLSDYSRLVVSYLWFAKLMGKASIDAIQISQIPAALHTAKSTYPSDLKITDQMKTDMIAAVNWTLANPYALPVA